MSRIGRDDDDPDDHVDGDDPGRSEAVERLRQAVSRAGGPSSVARVSGVPLRTLNYYLKGRDMKRAALVALAAATATNIEWLATGNGEREPPLLFRRAHSGEPLALSGLAEPGPGAPELNGNASLVEHPQIVRYLGHSTEYIRMILRREPGDLLVVEARGDGMEPTIRSGDLLTLDVLSGRSIANGQLYVLRVDDELLVKRLERRIDGSVVVHSDNPRYAPETVPPGALEALNILGQVILVTAPPR